MFKFNRIQFLEQIAFFILGAIVALLVSFADQPVMMEYNNGLGFVCNGVNPLSSKIVTEKTSNIEFNNNFTLTKKDEHDEMPF